MAESPVRIALLARAGEAREQLRKALLELGAELVAEGDPAELDPAQVQALAPKVVLISLEPAVEDALDRFGAVLAAPDVEVMFDDADVTRQLQGWDLARWARHLAAKLVGGSVLPPVPEGSQSLDHTDYTPEPGAPPTPAQLMDDARLEDYAGDAGSLALEVPATPSLADVELPDTLQLPEAIALDEPSIEVDLSMLEQALNAPMAESSASETTDSDVSGVDMATDLEVDFDQPARSFGELAEQSGQGEESFSLDVDLEGLERSLALGGAAPADTPEEVVPGGDGLMIDVDFDPAAPVSFASYSAEDDLSPTGLDDDVAALAAQLDAAQVESDAVELPDLDFSSAAAAPEPVLAEPSFSLDLPEPVIPAASGPQIERTSGGLELPDLDFPVPSAAAAAPVASSLGGLELSLMDDVPMAAVVPTKPSEPAPPSKPAGGMFAGLSLSLEGDEPAAPPEVHAMVLVLAGLGGPDAVKQLLAALPTNLPVPVLLSQHLDNGKYDKFSEQMAKGSKLPVVLAVSGQWAQPGQVAVLPRSLAIEASGAGYRFTSGELSEAVNVLPEGSAVMVCSGADAGLTPDLVVRRRHGVALYAQSPEACFDDIAAKAAIAAGATVGAASELAQLIAARWKR